MPFSPDRKDWCLRAWGHGDKNSARCQFRLYSEDKGFYLACDQKGSGLFMTRWTIQDWGTVGIPFCKHHFRTLSDLVPFTNDSVDTDLLPNVPTFHMDRKNIKDWCLDFYYFDYGKSVVTRYQSTHPEDKAPRDTRGHRYPTWSDDIALLFPD